MTEYASNEERQAFIDEISAHIKERHAHFGMYMCRETLGVLLSATDSREGNGANYRITTKEGKVISFMPDGDKCSDPGALGLIVALHNSISN